MQALMFDEHSVVNAYPSTPLPNGSIPVRGSAGGLSFPMNVHPDRTFSMFDASFIRPLNVSYTGEGHTLSLLAAMQEAAKLRFCFVKRTLWETLPCSRQHLRQSSQMQGRRPMRMVSALGTLGWLQQILQAVAVTARPRDVHTLISSRTPSMQA